MGGLEAVLTGLRDELSPALRKRKYSREIFTFLVVGSAGLFAIQNVTNVRLYVKNKIKFIYFLKSRWKFS